MTERFSKQDRICKRNEINRVFELGKSASDNIMHLYMLANNLGRSRLAVVISRRHGNAVRRNRVKRLCREAFRTSRDKLPQSYDYVINPRVGVELSLEAIKRSLQDLSERIVSEQRTSEQEDGGKS